jgi:hypothetical protein
VNFAWLRSNVAKHHVALNLTAARAVFLNSLQVRGFFTTCLFASPHILYHMSYAAFEHLKPARAVFLNSVQVRGFSTAHSLASPRIFGLV